VRIVSAVAALLLIAAPALGGVLVSFVPDQPTLLVGESVNIDAIADITAPTTLSTWGGDLVWGTPGVVNYAFGALGPLWVPGPNPDGDGLVGVNLSGVTGSVTLFSFSVTGLQEGATTLSWAQTPGDPSELFQGIECPEYPSFTPALITVIPEPATIALLGLGCVVFARRR